MGSLRDNMDPLNKCADTEILDVLDEAGLRDLILKKLEENEDEKNKVKDIAKSRAD